MCPEIPRPVSAFNDRMRDSSVQQWFAENWHTLGEIQVKVASFKSDF